MAPRAAVRPRKLPRRLLLSCCLAAACAAPGREPSQPAPARVTPSLAEIFSIPGLHGAPPSLRSLSADGRFALLDYKPVERSAEGALAWGEDHSPHLVDTRRAPCTPGESTSLAAWLTALVDDGGERTPSGRLAAAPAPGESAQEAPKPPRPGPLAWSENGALLAVEWQGALVLLDPAERAARVLYREPPEDAPPPGDEVDQQPQGRAEGATVEPPPRRIGRIRSLSFASQDRELEVRSAQELYVIDLEAAREAPLTLDGMRWVTEHVEPAIERLQISADRTRMFATAGTFGAPEGDSSKAATRFLDLALDRKLVLEGLAEIKWLESERLSPDGRFVFGVEADRSKDPPPNLVPNFLTPRVSTINARRDLADDLPPPRKLWMWSTADGSRRLLDLPGDAIHHFQPLGWAPQREPGAPARFAFRRLTRDFRTQETWLWSEGDLRLLMVDRDPKWIGGPSQGARWSRDGQRILFASESFGASSTPGRAQVFALDVERGHVRQLTQVAGEVSSFVEHESGIAAIASDGDPNERVLVFAPVDLGRAAQDGPAPAVAIELGAATASSLRVSRDGTRAVFALERLGRPAELHALELPSREPRALTRTLSPSYAAQDWILPRELVVEHADGSSIWAHVYLPRSSSLERPDRPRPCVVFIHGAGYLQNVTQSMTEYAVNLMFHSRLADLGYVVVDVDYRGSAGYGQKFRTDVQGHLGKLELEDIDAAVDELGRRNVIDVRRVGCYGGSYGGFLTLMALFTEPERWACGAALRSVTDWRSYSSGYTQPRLGRPSTDPEAYARSSPIDHAEKLEDPLLILHGMSDTNVFAQDSIRLIEKLIDLGKPFDAMLYPSQGHGFTDGPHWIDEYGRIERFFIQHLGAP